MSISIQSDARLYSRMEDKLSKGDNCKRFKKGSKREHGNFGPENFVQPTFKISGSGPAAHKKWEQNKKNSFMNNIDTKMVNELN